jgi:hypothetical protein
MGGFALTGHLCLLRKEDCPPGNVRLHSDSRAVQLADERDLFLPIQVRARVPINIRSLLYVLSLIIWSAQATAQTGTEKQFYARANTFGAFVAYSPDSSHMLLGNAENRELLDIGAFYSRRLFLNHFVNWQYNAEVLPVALESDPVAELTAYQTVPTVATFTQPYGPVLDCTPQSAQYNVTLPNGVTYSGTETVTCTGRRWTIGEGISPVGFQWNLRPRRRMQPFVIGHGGYMYSTKPIPVSAAGSFNFTFDLGAGVELFRSHKQSVRGEVRYHHISNHDTATQNPGVDNLLYQLSYAFGR